MKNLKAIKFVDDPKTIERIEQMVHESNAELTLIDHDKHLLIVGDSDGHTFEVKENDYIVKYIGLFSCGNVTFEENTDFVAPPNEYVLTGDVKPLPKKCLGWISSAADLTSKSLLFLSYLLGAVGMGLLFFVLNWILRMIVGLDVATISNGEAFILGFVGCLVLRNIDYYYTNKKKEDINAVRD